MSLTEIYVTLQSVVPSVINVIVFKEFAVTFYFCNFSAMRESTLVMAAAGGQTRHLLSPLQNFWKKSKLKKIKKYTKY
jgi:hypothetical protein